MEVGKRYGEAVLIRALLVEWAKHYSSGIVLCLRGVKYFIGNRMMMLSCHENSDVEFRSSILVAAQPYDLTRILPSAFTNWTPLVSGSAPQPRDRENLEFTNEVSL